LNRPPFVTPQSKNGGSFVVPLCFKVFAEEVISQDARLWQAITSAADFEVELAVLVTSLEVALFHEFRQDVSNFDADMFWVLHWCVQVEVFQINGAKPGTFS